MPHRDSEFCPPSSRDQISALGLLISR